MTTNAEYQKASDAILEYKKNVYPDLQSAVEVHGANLQLATILLGNENVLTVDEMVDDSVRQLRTDNCNSCDQLLPENGGTCNQCACPISFITNLKFKTCPLGKW